MNELTVYSNKDNLDKVFEFIEDTLDNSDISPKCKMQLELAAEEIFVNIVNYAYDKDGEVTIRKEVLPDLNSISITFIDSGIEFNPLIKETPDLSLSADERPIGGLGILLIEKNVDSVSYEYLQDKNHLTIIKKLF